MKKKKTPIVIIRFLLTLVTKVHDIKVRVQKDLKGNTTKGRWDSVAGLVSEGHSHAKIRFL